MRWILVFWLLPLAWIRADLEWTTQSVEGHPKLGERAFVAHYGFKNTGNTEARILSVRTSCGCTEAQASKEIFLPGESGEIVAIFSIGEKTGIHAETIAVEMKGAESTKLSIKVSIPSAVTFSPSKLIWKAGEAATAKQAVATIAKEASLRLIRVTANDGRLVVKLEPTAENGRYLVTVTPKSTAELIRSTITVSAEDRGRKPFTFSLYIWIR